MKWFMQLVSLSIAEKRDAAAMLAQITESPTRATKIKKNH